MFTCIEQIFVALLYQNYETSSNGHYLVDSDKAYMVHLHDILLHYH